MIDAISKPCCRRSRASTLASPASSAGRAFGRQYLIGLALPIERENVENIAEQVGAPPRKLQEFLSDSPWDDEGCIGELQRCVGEQLGAPSGVLILDDRIRRTRGLPDISCGHISSLRPENHPRANQLSISATFGLRLRTQTPGVSAQVAFRAVARWAARSQKGRHRAAQKVDSQGGLLRSERLPGRRFSTGLSGP